MDFRGRFGSVWTPAPGVTIMWRVRTGQCLDRLAPHVHRRVNGHAATLRRQASMALSLSLLQAHTPRTHAQMQADTRRVKYVTLNDQGVTQA